MLRCFICAEKELPINLKAQTSKFLGLQDFFDRSWSTQRRYNVQRLHEDDHEGKCRNDLFNSFVDCTKESAQTLMAIEESRKLKRKRTCSEYAAVPSSSARCSTPVNKLRYKNVCILCNQQAQLFTNNPAEATKSTRCQIIWLQTDWRPAGWKQHSHMEMTGALKLLDAWKL